ncbi:acyltransferase [Terasakiella sp. SH-1]|uniref:acyltransferase n=1 Tax=Terasakiella sp. SH-1 TaxID=2560057 RepID=UPI0010749A29|nr:acyltransferase [Terasakiella sp. SH-1]
MSTLQTFKQWAKHSPSPLARFVRTLHSSRQSLEIPKAFTVLYSPLFTVHRSLQTLFAWMGQTFYSTPLFKSQIQGTAQKLNLYGGLPLISGPLDITCADRCRISGATTFSGRTSATKRPQLKIGNNVGIGWQTTIAVGSSVILEDNVRMGGRNFLAGYPGHPLDAQERAAGLADHDDQVGDIILKKDVWIGTGAMIMAGVTIGEGTIVAAGSIVTKPLPAHVLAGGNPARVIKQLPKTEWEAAQ